MTAEQNIIYDVVGIGNALVDVLAKVSDKFLTERGLTKGSMTLVDAKTAGLIYNDMIAEREVSGGSVANTMAGLAALGNDCAFIGKVYDDELGQKFKRDIGRIGIDFETEPLLKGPATGRSIVLVTPDAERSMFTYLGAAKLLCAADIDENVIAMAKYVFLESYLWDFEDSKEALFKAAKLAQKHGRKVALTLCDVNYVVAHRNEMRPFIEEYVDLLFANENEIKALFDTQDLDVALDKIKSMIEIAAITRRNKGSVVVSGKIKTFVEAEKVEDVVDSSGAGDLYAAGFLHALLEDKPLGICALIGGIVASEVITHYGARPETSLKSLIRKKLMQYMQNS